MNRLRREATGPRRAARPFDTSPEVLLVTCGIVLQFMSGFSDRFFLPIPIDRPLVLAGLLVAAYRAMREGRHWRPTAIHYTILLLLGWVLVSMAWSGSLTSSLAVFYWLDAVGLVPFSIYLFVPLVYSTPERRRVLLVGLTLLGAYLGGIALLEGLGMYQWVWPQYIYDPDSSHFGRARGPAGRVASNGLQLMACGLAAFALARTLRSRGLAVASYVVTTLCLVGTFLTLTRAIWIGVAIGIVGALAVDRRTQKWLAAGFVSTFGALLLGLALVPGLREAVEARLADSRSGFDRLNANAAAVRVVGARPFEGLGFAQFPAAENDWLWQSPGYPVTSTGIAVHNVPLGYATELGLPGAGLWIAGLMLAILYAWRSPLQAADSVVLRRIAIAYVLCWLVVGMFTPMTYALPATMLWLFLALPTHPSWLGYGEANVRFTGEAAPVTGAHASTRSAV